MTFKKQVTRGFGSAVVVTAALGASLLTAGPAAASDTLGSWKAFGSTNPITSSSSTWKCGSTVTIDSSVSAQACAIRSSSGSSVQAAVIVRNNRSALYGAEAAMELWRWDNGGRYGRWSCPRSGVGARSWSVCFGETLPIATQVKVPAAGVNGQNLPGSGVI